MLRLSLYKKFAIIVLVVTTSILLYVCYEWFPTVVASSHDKYEVEINSHIKMVGEGIIPFLIQNDYSNIYDTLDAIQKDNTLWLAIALYDPNGESIYPLDEIDFSKQPLGSRLFEQNISVEGKHLGRIKVVYDFDSVHRDLNKLLTQFYIVLSIALSVLLLLTLGGLFHFIFKPVRALTTATQGVIQENYDIHVPNLGNNDINVLAQNFVRMRNKIANDKESLSRINAELTEALTTASEKSIMLDAIISGAADAIVIFDAQGAIIIFNKVAETIFGTTAKVMLGQHIATLFPKYTYEEHLHGFQLEQASSPLGSMHAFEETLALRHNGEEFPISIAYSRYPIHGEDTYTLIIKDISEAIAARNELQDAKEKAEQASIAKSEFLATMSHEIRTPMNGVLGMLTLLKKQDLNAAQQRFTDIAVSSANSLLSIINDILDYSKIEAGMLSLDPFEFDLRREINDLAAAYALRAKDKQLLLIADVADITQSSLCADWHRLRQVLVNLIGNALKFTEHGQIIIRVSTFENTDGSWQLHCSVQDSGIGIAHDAIPHLFERFTQADNSTTRRYGGTGLGLAICKKLIEQMHGQIAVTSEQGHGTCFTFTVPVAAAKACRETAILPSNLLARPAYIFDDNHAHAMCLARQLSQWGMTNTLIDLSQTHGLAPLVDDNALLLISTSGSENNSTVHWRDLVNQHARPTRLIVLMHPLDDQPDLHFAPQNLSIRLCPRPMNYDDLLKALGVSSPTITALSENSVNGSSAKSKQPLNANILLVEDNAINSEIAAGILEDFGCRVTLAENGEAAIHALQSTAQVSPFDIILMDCQMPVMDGYEATRQIRQGVAGEHYAKETPIIAMTANAMAGDDDKCFAAGMTDYLAKPFDEDVLIKKLAQYVKA